MPMCNCGPTFECALMHNCVPKCGLEEHVWEPATNQRVNAVVVSPPLENGTIVATASPDYLVRLWYVDAGSRLAAPHHIISKHWLGPANALVFSLARPGLLASAGDDLCVFWHDVNAILEGKSPEEQVLHKFQSPVGVQQAILAIAFSADGHWFAVAGAQSATLWNVATKKLHRTLEPAISNQISSGSYALGESSPVANLAFASDSRWLAFRLPRTVQLWPLAEVMPNPQSRNADGEVLPEISTDPPSLGEWVKYTGEDIAKALLHWSTRKGPAANRPVYEALLNTTAIPNELGLHFTPCNVSATYHACAEDLPWIRVDLEVPFDFTAVRGSFIEFSQGPNGADDCRGGTRHSSWEDEEQSRYWTMLMPGMRAEGEDCPRVGGGNLSKGIGWLDGAMSTAASLEECKMECEAMLICNFMNWRTKPKSCDLRKCQDATNPGLTASPDDFAWALVVRHEAEERLAPTADGYVMFGSPGVTGSGGILYGGCGAGPEISQHGVEIKIEQTTVPKTRFLRWQVAQSRNTEKLGIRAVFLELWRPIEGRLSLSVESSSPVLAFSPARRELTVAMGEGADMAVWDLRGIDFPAAYTAERLLKQAFSFELEAVGLMEIDRVRIVDAGVVPVCGDAFSAVTSPTVQGLGEGIRDRGTHNFSLWDNVVATTAGNYRICFCGGRRTSCCVQDSDFATQLFMFVVAGAAADHYAVCEAQTFGGTLECIIKGFHGSGIVDGDKIMVQDAPACGLATSPIAGLPHSGVLIARKPHVPRDSRTHHAAGTWYRFESRNDPFDTYRVENIDAKAGVTAKLCWCPLAAKCDASKPEGFRIDAGLLTVIYFKKPTDNYCQIGKPCLVTFELAPVNSPVSVSDLVMVKRGSSPPNRLATYNDPKTCTGEPVRGLGPDGDKGLGPDGDAISARLQVGYDTRAGAKITDRELGLFEMGIVATGTDGSYRLCWCQASIRPCREAHEFVADIGKLVIQKAKYVWPDCADREVQFTGWRIHGTFDECCCNHNEAGTVGCHSEKTDTFARCSKLPRR